jgi:hypothetical protein
MAANFDIQFHAEYVNEQYVNCESWTHDRHRWDLSDMGNPLFSLHMICRDVQIWGTLAQCIAYSCHEEKGKSYSRDMNTFMIDDNTQAVGMQQHLANELLPASSSS